jgi:hypothetical protein
MFPFNGLVRGLAQRTRDRLVRGLRSELADARAEITALRRELDEVRTDALSLANRNALAAAQAAVGGLHKEIARVRAEVEPGHRANRVLADIGVLVNLSQADRVGDVTVQGAMGYLSWESAVAAYRPAFQAAIDYLRSVGARGPVVEFGTCTGFTARLVCDLMNTREFDEHLYLYDSFEGLPETTGTPDETSYEVRERKVWYRGSMAVPPGYEDRILEALHKVRPVDRIHLVKGFFDQTLDTGLPKQKCSLIHIDCDIYTSTKYVLDRLAEKDLFQDGCVVMFDDFNCNRANPNMGERRALAEFLAEHPRWTCSPWFTYGWHAQAFFFHDRDRGS